jgi:hypothetical protein
VDKKHAYLVQNKDRGAGKIALDKVSDLPEVSDYLQQIPKSQSNGWYFIILRQSPDKDFKYYCDKSWYKRYRVCLALILPSMLIQKPIKYFMPIIFTATGRTTFNHCAMA